ncbi:hypothetical protein NM208_g3990 [Fusarium decemcellulare]|uniref:Uncharacterized protein n=1 Tax=Fusarium decemcellulare TaxID=57161 RepID=A0ACC1SMC8_9HYPO|nr:hypothetical protein NM208_g3990 [Fusarium decemcellulare]
MQPAKLGHCQIEIEVKGWSLSQQDFLTAPDILSNKDLNDLGTYYAAVISQVDLHSSHERLKRGDAVIVVVEGCIRQKPRQLFINTLGVTRITPPLRAAPPPGLWLPSAGSLVGDQLQASLEHFAFSGRLINRVLVDNDALVALSRSTSSTSRSFTAIGLLVLRPRSMTRHMKETTMPLIEGTIQTARLSTSLSARIYERGVQSTTKERGIEPVAVAARLDDALLRLLFTNTPIISKMTYLALVLPDSLDGLGRSIIPCMVVQGAKHPPPPPAAANLVSSLSPRGIGIVPPNRTISKGSDQARLLRNVKKFGESSTAPWSPSLPQCASVVEVNVRPSLKVHRLLLD